MSEAGDLSDLVLVLAIVLWFPAVAMVTWLFESRTRK